MYMHMYRSHVSMHMYRAHVSADAVVPCVSTGLLIGGSWVRGWTGLAYRFNVVYKVLDVIGLTVAL